MQTSFVLASASNICAKRWIYEQYDSMVQTNTVQGPGGEAGVMRMKGTARGLGDGLDGNSRWCYLDPKLGARHAVAEAARKVACTGATPVAATNCLNFGNPEKPEIMAQLSQRHRRHRARPASRSARRSPAAMFLSITRPRRSGFIPLRCLGLSASWSKLTKAVPSDFQRVGDAVLLIAPASLSPLEERMQRIRLFGIRQDSSFGALWGTPPYLDLHGRSRSHKSSGELARAGLIHSARDISDGGIAVALAEGMLRSMESAFAPNLRRRRTCRHEVGSFRERRPARSSSLAARQRSRRSRR